MSAAKQRLAFPVPISDGSVMPDDRPRPAEPAPRPAASLAPSGAPAAAAPGARLCECHGCGLLQALAPLPPGTLARCPRCHTMLRRARSNPLSRALALTATGLLLFIMATNMPFIEVHLSGINRSTTLITGPLELEQLGMWPLSIVFVITVIAAPLIRLLALLGVLFGLRLRHPPVWLPTSWLPVAFRWADRLRPWAMIEVFLLGVFVAYTKLIDLAQVDLGGAAYALGGLMLAMAAADAALDPQVVWEDLQRRGITASPMIPPPATPDPAPLHGQKRSWVACDCCELVTRVTGHASAHCPRCGAALHRRKPHSLARSLALLAAGFVMYIPANLLPVMTVVRLGRGEADTILAGVQSLAEAGMWPLAALVFVASITVPVLKLVGLSMLLITTHRGSAWRLVERTLIYRIVDGIGRWSMIDVFMVSILTALVRMGRLASVYPDPGVLAFCSVVILTMFAAMSFDPRLMWDAAAARAARPARLIAPPRAQANAQPAAPIA
jgi:paraquat-inducible protein A